MTSKNLTTLTWQVGGKKQLQHLKRQRKFDVMSIPLRFVCLGIRITDQNLHTQRLQVWIYLPLSTYKSCRFTQSSSNKLAILHSPTGHHCVFIANYKGLRWICFFSFSIIQRSINTQWENPQSESNLEISPSQITSLPRTFPDQRPFLVEFSRKNCAEIQHW